MEDLVASGHITPHRLEKAALVRIRGRLGPLYLLCGTLLLALTVYTLLSQATGYSLLLAISSAAPSLGFFVLFAMQQHHHASPRWTRTFLYITTALVLIPTLAHSVLRPDSPHLEATILGMFVVGLMVPLWRVTALILTGTYLAWNAIFFSSSASDLDLTNPILMTTAVLVATGINALVIRELHQQEEAQYQNRILQDRNSLLKQKRRAAVQAHLRTQTGLQQLIQQSQDGVLILQNHTVVFANRSLRLETGFHKRDLLGQTLEILLTQEDQDLADAEIISQESKQGLELNVRRANNSTYLAEVRAAEIEYGDGPAQMIQIRPVPAVSRKVATERALLADRMITIGTIAAGVAHEINNPLAYVMANLEMLHLDLSEMNDPGMESHVSLIQTSMEGAQRIRQIVTDVLSFSRAEDSKDEVIHIQDLLETSIRMSWNQIRHRASLVREYSDIPGVTGNSARLGQVFLNLLVNAAQSIGEDDETRNQIGVRTQRNGPFVRIEIYDTGKGISTDALPHIFTAFFTTKPDGVGTGLGLSFCKRVIEEMNGTISAHTELGKGTTIRLDLPASSESPASQETLTSMPPVSDRPSTLKILVIDDEAAMAKSIAFILRGDEVVQAQTGLEALHILDEDNTFDAILCDLMMPHHSGAKLYPMITERHPRMRNRVGFVTGGSFTEQTRNFIESTQCPVLLKPFRARDLLDLVDSLSSPETKT